MMRKLNQSYTLFVEQKNEKAERRIPVKVTEFPNSFNKLTNWGETSEYFVLPGGKLKETPQAMGSANSR